MNHHCGFKNKCKNDPDTEGADLFFKKNKKLAKGKTIVKTKMYPQNDSLFDDENMSTAKLKHTKNYDKAEKDEETLTELAEMEAQAALIAL